MQVKVFDAVKLVPIHEFDLSQYCTVEQAAKDSGIAEAIIWQLVHRSRRVGSAIVGNSRLVLRSDLERVAQEDKSPEVANAA